MAIAPPWALIRSLASRLRVLLRAKEHGCAECGRLNDRVQAGVVQKSATYIRDVGLVA